MGNVASIKCNVGALYLSVSDVQGCQHWEMKSQKILTDVLLGGIGMSGSLGSPRNLFKILNVLWFILNISKIDFYILLYEIGK